MGDTTYFATFQPALVTTGADGELATVLTSWQISDPNPPTQLWHTTFDPWNAWPEGGTLEDSRLIDSDVGYSKLAGRDLDRFSVLFASLSPPSPGAPGLVFMPNLEGHSGLLAESVTLAGVDARPGFADGREGNAHLVGWADSGVWPEVVKLALVKDTPEGLSLQSQLAVGCATETTHQAAAWVEPGAWISAFSSGAPFAADDCTVGTGRAGPPDRVLVVRAEASGVDTSISGLELPIDDALETLWVVPRSNGAFVVWTTFSKIEITEIDLAPTVVGGPTSTVSRPVVGVAPYADGVAFVELHSDAEPSPVLTLSIFDGSGFSESIGKLSLGAPAQGPISVLTRPGDPRVVVAWTEESDKLRVKVARFDCEL
jgi:hypothetical protein